MLAQSEALWVNRPEQTCLSLFSMWAGHCAFSPHRQKITRSSQVGWVFSLSLWGEEVCLEDSLINARKRRPPGRLSLSTVPSCNKWIILPAEQNHVSKWVSSKQAAAFPPSGHMGTLGVLEILGKWIAGNKMVNLKSSGLDLGAEHFRGGGSNGCNWVWEGSRDFMSQVLCSLMGLSIYKGRIPHKSGQISFFKFQIYKQMQWV